MGHRRATARCLLPSYHPLRRATAHCWSCYPTAYASRTRPPRHAPASSLTPILAPALTLTLPLLLALLSNPSPYHPEQARSGLLFLEPLRRLALLAAASAAATAAASAAATAASASSAATAAASAATAAATDDSAVPMTTAAAEQEQEEAVAPPPLQGYVALLRGTNTAAAEYTPLAEEALSEACSDAACCHRAAPPHPPPGVAGYPPLRPPVAGYLPLPALLSVALGPLTRRGAPAYVWSPLERFLPCAELQVRLG